MASAFLWSASPHITSQAKVSWKDICVSKQEGGLGIRRLHDSSIVFSLKLIWRLLTHSGSLWVDWVHKYLFRGSSFWEIKNTTTLGSWMWKKLLKLRPIATTLIKVEVGDGRITSFWHDNWLSIGPLIQITGEEGTRRLGVPKKAKVIDASNGNVWKLRNCRDQHLQEIVRQIRAAPIPTSEAGRDRMLWKQKSDVYEHRFSAKKTWELIRNKRNVAAWANLVWFKQAVPRQGFITWLALRSRLATGDRIRVWGGAQECTFCSETNETRNHLFFACPYTYMVWTSLLHSIAGSRLSPDWSTTIHRLLHNRLSKTDSQLLRMVFQTTVYWIWRERNGRRHQRPHTSRQNLTRIIHKEVFNRLYSLCASPPLEEDDEAINRWLQIPLQNLIT